MTTHGCHDDVGLSIKATEHFLVTAQAVEVSLRCKHEKEIWLEKFSQSWLHLDGFCKSPVLQKSIYSQTNASMRAFVASFERTESFQQLTCSTGILTNKREFLGEFINAGNW